MPKVMSTTNYKKFELYDLNRDVKINHKKFKSLVQSMKNIGFKSSKHINCVKNGNGKLKIKEGHNRFVAAVKLGIPVKYMIDEDDISIYELEQTKSSWTMFDYLSSHVKGGGRDYFLLQKYIEKTGINISNAISIFSGISTYSGTTVAKFKAGTFKILDTKRAKVIADVVEICRNNRIVFATNKHFITALLRVMWVHAFDSKVFIKKIKNFPFLMEKQPSVMLYQLMIEKIYNYHNRKKINLSFLADEIMKSKRVAK